MSNNTCPRCKGTKLWDGEKTRYIGNEDCPTCHGTGYVNPMETTAEALVRKFDHSITSNYQPATPTAEATSTKCPTCGKTNFPVWNDKGECIKCARDRVLGTGTVQPQEPCVFCERITNGEYDDKFADHVIFEPLNPVVKGHRLVVPVKHTANLNDPNLAAEQTGWALRYFTNDLDSYNIITSKGAAATQTVQHLHFHIVPRTKGDGLKLPWTVQPTPDTIEPNIEVPTPDIDTTEPYGGSIPMGVGQWKAHGIRFGYWTFFADNPADKESVVRENRTVDITDKVEEHNQLDLNRMLTEIDNLVEQDFVADMELQTLPNSRPYTQNEALLMSELLSSIYTISHCLHCRACQGRYKLEIEGYHTGYCPTCDDIMPKPHEHKINPPDTDLNQWCYDHNIGSNTKYEISKLITAAEVRGGVNQLDWVVKQRPSLGVYVKIQNRIKELKEQL